MSDQPHKPTYKPTEKTFEEYKKHFDTSTCEEDAYRWAQWMVKADLGKSRALLPHIKNGDKPDTEIPLAKYDLNKDFGVSNPEWAAALTAMKELKLPAGKILNPQEADQFIDKSCGINKTYTGKVDQCRII